MAREEVKLREITVEDLWREVQALRNALQTHNHLDLGNAQMLTGALNGIFQSSNFKSGVSGCQINWDSGFAEFNAGIYRSSVSIGKSSYADNTPGIWMGLVAGVAKLNIGNADKWMKWDGSGLTVKGTINALDGYLGAADTTINVSTSGLNVGTTGHIRGGQTDFNTGVGFFLGYSTDAYKFSIGNPDTYYFTWDGTVLKIKGDTVIGGEYSAGDTYAGGANTDNNTFSVTYVKKKEIQTGLRGTFRIKFDISTNNADGAAYGQIYKNGVAVGIERSTVSVNYVTFSQDLYFLPTDLIQLYVHATSPRGCYYRNFQVCFADFFPVITINQDD